MRLTINKPSFILPHIILFSVLINNSFAADSKFKGSMKVPLVNVERDNFNTILPAKYLSDKGVVSDLVIRPRKNERLFPPSIKVFRNGIEGDKNRNNDSDKNRLRAITLIRSDVSDVLKTKNGHATGDNIHVRGVNISKENLNVGDIIMIGNNNDNADNLLLLVTHYPHHACGFFVMRCGIEARNLINNIGPYEYGFDGEHGHVDGIADRLRGLKLAVLNEQAIRIAINDNVEILRGDDKEIIINEFKETYEYLLSISEEHGRIEEEKFQNKRLRLQSLMNNERSNILYENCNKVTVLAVLILLASMCMC